ncbi:neurogenic locus notch homolog protein 2, partial [Tachysurus ichikawai]
CKPGYQGVNCEYDVNECHSNPCRHGGTCINLENHFYCSCPPGTKGQQCEVDVDECSTEFGPPCLNDGRCVDGIGHYTCVCPPGFTGERCEGDINECRPYPCHSIGSLDCVQLANDYQCRCRLGYTGRLCDSMVDLCQSKPCHNGGKCSMSTSSVHGYSCTCLPGYTGSNCGQIEDYTCANQRCQNGGQCQTSPSGRSQCGCPSGFSGRLCEIEKPSCSCQNGGMCIQDQHKSYLFSCHCPDGYSGEHCQNKVSATSCPYVECQMRRGDKVCDPQCKKVECDWDGGDCSLQWLHPWENCTATAPCWMYFNNNRCDPECNNPGCLYDSFECQDGPVPVPNTCKYETYCRDHYQNGHCNEGCNTAACGWDGLDCSNSKAPQLADGTLIIVVLLHPTELLGDMKGFLRSLGMLLHTNVRFKLNDQQEPMVYPYYGNEQDELNAGAAKRLSKRELKKEVIGSKVYLEIDNRQCAETSNECFSSTDLVASYIAAKSIREGLNYPIISVDSMPPDKFVPPLFYLVAVAAAIILLILILGVLVAKRKRKNGILWLPDGFLAKKDSKRREPVGQDDFGMKSLQKSQMDGSADHHWPEEELRPKKPRLEDKPLLGVDTEVDRREWTLQHHKAADITLTPPQADIDMDCLDVNVKGPDGFTPLMLASLRGGSSPECVSVLADEEEESGVDEPGTNMISDLIAQGATLNAQTERTGETALHLAARYSRADAAKRLLDAGADPNAHDNMGRTPLHAAIAADAQGVFQILIRNRATELDARMNDGTTPLILAARLAVEGMVEELVHCHADVNAVDDHGKSALHWAAAVNNVEATLVLLKNGANRDMQDNKEETPLFLAAREGSFEAAQVLLDHYSNRDITDHLDRLPRDTAQERMHHDIVRLLDQYNLVHSPHSGSNHVGNGGGGHPSVVCTSNGVIGMRPGQQNKKNRRGGGGAAKLGGPNGAGGGVKDLKEMKTKRRKKPAGGEASGLATSSGNVATVTANSNGTKGPTTAGTGGLSESSVTMSPVDSLESPHSYTTDASGAANMAKSPPLMTSPSTRPLLPPVSHMLGQQPSWVGVAKHGYAAPHLFSHMIPHQMAVARSGMPQHHHGSGMLGPVNVSVSREQLPSIVTFQMNQALLKPNQQGAMQVSQSQAQGLSHMHCGQEMMYNMQEAALQHGISHLHGLAHNIAEPQVRQVMPYHQQMQSPVDKYPTPPSHRSYASGAGSEVVTTPGQGSEVTTPGHGAPPSSEHPYLTPSPESPDPWSSSSSPHSHSDWSDVTTSPHAALHTHAHPHTHAHTHVQEQAPLLQPQPSQSAQQPLQQQACSSVYA